MKKPRALVVDDEPDIRELLSITLERMNLDVTAAETIAAATRELRANAFDLCLTDMRLPDGDGLSLVEWIQTHKPQTPVAVITAHGNVETAVRALKLGAFDFISKPVDVAALRKLIGATLKLGENIESTMQLPQVKLLGRSRAMEQLREMIERVARSQAPVHIYGESGTGKELVARALHRHSPRANKAFIALNTSAFTADLLESELFGHEKGSFTGADAQRRGRFEQADGGTLFLDEIGDMSPQLQTRLLRVLAEGEFYRVGGQVPVRVDVRVIAATHQDLEDRVKQNLFREDLLHRLNVIRIEVPPLRQRREDIPELLMHYLTEAAVELGVEPKILTPEAAAALSNFDWPGNVRQLVNACRRLTVTAPGREIKAEDIPSDLGGVPGPAKLQDEWTRQLTNWAEKRLAAGETPLLDDAMPEFERTLIRAALRKAEGGRQEAAKLLGWGRNTLTRKLKELAMDDE